jgi:hypothetical protein
MSGEGEWLLATAQAFRIQKAGFRRKAQRTGDRLSALTTGTFDVSDLAVAYSVWMLNSDS